MRNSPELSLDDVADLAYRTAMEIIERCVAAEDQPEVKRRVVLQLQLNRPIRVFSKRADWRK